jgi:hypothetical protein
MSTIWRITGGEKYLQRGRGRGIWFLDNSIDFCQIILRKKSHEILPNCTSNSDNRAQFGTTEDV